MKRIIYALVALATAAIGCTKSDIVDVPEVKKTPITFDTYNGRTPVTKASEITRDIISAIHVTAFEVAPTATAAASYKSYYMDKEVSRVKNGSTWGNWGYSPLMYWPATNSLEFVAYGSNTPRTSSEEPGKLVPIEGSYIEYNYTVPVDVTDQQDLIVGYKQPTAATTSSIVFSMKHLLSRVGFKLVTEGTGTSVTINNVTLHGTFKTTAGIDLTATNTEADPILTIAEDSPTKTSYSLFAEGQSFVTTNATGTSEGDAMHYDIYPTSDASNRYMMLLPGTIGDLTNTQDVYDIDGDGDTDEKTTAPYVEVSFQLGTATPRTVRVAVPSTHLTLIAGYAYELALEIKISEIKFTGTVEEWDDDTIPSTPIN